MNHLTNITKKELKELLTPGSIASVVVVVILFMAIGTLAGSEMDDVGTATKVGFINGDEGGTWSDFTVDSIYDFYESTYGMTEEQAKEYVILLNAPYGDQTAIMDQMMDNGLDSAFGIGPDFSSNIDKQVQSIISEYYVFMNQGLIGSTSSTISSTIVQYVSLSISEELVSQEVGGESAAFIMQPIKKVDPYTYIDGDVYEGITPIEISNAVTSQTLMVPIIIMIVIVMIGSIVISSMGNEKENKTLETLLTLPVKRTTIVSGKLIASAIVGLIFGLAYMVGMVFYMGGMTSGLGSVNLADYGLGLNITDWAVIAVMIFLGIFCALGICMLLGAFAKNYKSAQTMTLPISVLAMIPMFILMFSSWDALPSFLQAILFLIPFSHPMMVMENLMFGDFTLVASGLVYLALFSLVTILATVKVYNSDILITGLGQTKLARMFRSDKKRTKDAE